MPTAVFRGPKPRLTIRATGARLPRGAEVEVTHREAELLVASTANVDVAGMVDLDGFTVPELERLCREVGLPTDGRKAELVDRLLDTTAGSAPPEPSDD